MEDLQVTRISAYGLVFDGNRLLLCRLSGDLPDAGKWTLPGGGIEFGEAPEAAMIREVEEETGLQVVSAGLAGIDSFTHSTPGRSFHGVRIVYHTRVVGGVLRHELDGTTDMCAWHPIDSFEDIGVVELVRSVRPMIARGA